ncbi:hypothetical protein [Serratia fonticola]|uniref:hypothetical protein n=1 Tax=Serratia fonticola TaxID=47917 RepID=UPI0015C5D307|nr:hypothetical protein [Serratia fonticola]NYA45746.1 hypothetical protein [Serratia fonticola]CAI1685340.1 Uncharacterised protein [Serratia fonticola]
MKTDTIAVWAMAGTWFTGVMTMLALLCAAIALNTWRKQEQTKAKMEFKKALLSLRNLLLFMPETWTRDQLALGEKLKNSPGYAKTMNYIEVGVAENLFAFTKALNHANDCWVLCEHLFDGTEVSSKWESAQDCMNNYLKNRKGKDDVFNALNGIYSMRFVFNHK